MRKFRKANRDTPIDRLPGLRRPGGGGALARDPDASRWSGKTLSSGQLARVYGFTDIDGSQPDAWRCVSEVQDAGKPADTTDDR